MCADHIRVVGGTASPALHEASVAGSRCTLEVFVERQFDGIASGSGSETGPIAEIATATDGAHLHGVFGVGGQVVEGVRRGGYRGGGPVGLVGGFVAQLPRGFLVACTPADSDVLVVGSVVVNVRDNTGHRHHFIASVELDGRTFVGTSTGAGVGRILVFSVTLFVNGCIGLRMRVEHIGGTVVCKGIIIYYQHQIAGAIVAEGLVEFKHVPAL